MRTFTSPDITLDELQAFTTDDVISVYSGKPGCSCGCRGTYRYASAAVADGTATQHVGYAVGADAVNDRQVKKVLGLVQRAAAAQSKDVEYGPNNVALNVRDAAGEVVRVYVVYPR